MGEIPTRHTLPRPWLTDAVLDDKNAIAQPYIAAAAAWSRAFGVLSLLCATLNVTSGRTGMKRNEAEKCRMELQKREIEVEAPENWGAPR